MMSKQIIYPSKQGITLLEFLTSVIIIALVVLFAIPRFSRTFDEGEKTRLDLIARAFTKALNVAKMHWVAEGKPYLIIDDKRYYTVNYDGVDLWLTRSDDEVGNKTGYLDGYPYSIRVGLDAPSNVIDDQDCVDLIGTLLNQPPKVVTREAVSYNENAEFVAQANNSDATCFYIQYGSVDELGFVYDFKKGHVTAILQ